VAGFRAFVEASGYKPRDRRSLRWVDDHPVMWVSWGDALAYCRWLGRETGLPVTLPSEAEWEKAARGTDGRIYPWGDEWDTERCNTAEGGAGATTPVGRYSPGGDSPYGCADMAGNVWDWTRSVFKGYPYDPKDGREGLEAGDNILRAVRGGSFDNDRLSARCAARLRLYSNGRYRGCGFRIVVSPISSPSGL
jgi:formylglycine-generating enzyme required for sulfatase activity